MFAPIRHIQFGYQMDSNHGLLSPLRSGSDLRPGYFFSNFSDVDGVKVRTQGRRLLVVDDLKENCVLLNEFLSSEGFEVREAYSGKEAIAIAKEWSPHLILMDHDMPGMNGVEATRIIRKEKLDADIVFISANASPNIVSEALDAGADDYIPKPYSFKELIARVMVRFRIRQLVEELQEANLKLLDLSLHDDLTGLLNMRNAYDRIEIELTRVRRSGGSIACIMFDIDKFKSVNDCHDHLFGSFVLKEMGAMIQKAIRKVDLGIRYGGDEFLILLTDATTIGAKIFSERLRKTVLDHVFESGKDKMKLSISIGFAMSPTDGKISARDLVRAADNALYEAKDGGRNKVCGYDSHEVLAKLQVIHSKKSA